MKRIFNIFLMGALSLTGFAQDGNQTPPEIRGLGMNQSINCLSEPVELAVIVDGWQAGFQYLWSTGSTDSILVVKPNATTVYTVTVSNNDLNMAQSLSFEVMVNNNPIVVKDAIFTLPKTVCPGSDLQINVNPEGGHGDYRYDWSFGSTDVEPTIQPSTNVTHQVTITDACGSTASASINIEIEVHEPISVDPYITQTYLCANKTLELSPKLSNVDGGVGYGYTYRFLGKAANENLFIQPEATRRKSYRVDVTDACGFQSVEQIIAIEQEEIEPITAPELFACSNEPVNIVASEDGFYYWDGNAMHANYEVLAKRSKSYELRYIDACGLEQVTERKLNVEHIELDMTYNIEHLDREIFAFASDDNSLSNHKWFLNGNLISNDEQIELTDLETDQNELSFEATSDLGCRYEERRTVIFQDGVDIPSAISPNGDGLNETLRVNFEENLRTFDIAIFDRWGQKVFSSSNQAFEWSPSEGQVIGPIGTFAYVLKAETEGGRKIEKTGVLTTIHAK